MRTVQERRMRKLAVLVLAMALLVSNAAKATAEYAPSAGFGSAGNLPLFVEKSPMEQFPEYREATGDVISHLKRYMSQLEWFRVDVLEGYNRSVIAFIDQLTAAANQLELEYIRGVVARSDYDQRHAYIVAELGKTREKGKYMAAYFTCLGKYRFEARLVAEQIARRQKDALRF